MVQPHVNNPRERPEDWIAIETNHNNSHFLLMIHLYSTIFSQITEGLSKESGTEIGNSLEFVVPPSCTPSRAVKG